MSNYRRAYSTGASYFFTLVAYRRENILCEHALRLALRSANLKNTHRTTFRDRCLGAVTRSSALHLDFAARRRGFLDTLEHDQASSELGMP